MIEMTPKMAKAGRDELIALGYENVEFTDAQRVFDAMIAAAPQPPAAQEPWGWLINGQSDRGIEKDKITCVEDVARHYMEDPCFTVEPLYRRPPAPANNRVRELETRLKDIEDAILACEKGLTIQDVLANYRAVRRTIHAARAALANGGK